MKNEFDVSDLAWKTYRLMYKDNFPAEFQVLGDDDSRQRRCMIEKYANKGRTSASRLLFSGDTDFNFTKGFAHSRLENYRKWLSDVPKFRDMYQNHLTIMEDLTYSVVNISLMPQSGNLQGVKQGVGNDRMDTFIWALTAYYEGSANVLFNHASYENTEALEDYLSMFENVYDYCQTVYHINASLVDDLAASGACPIRTPEEILRFMTLAIRFWRQKSSFLHEQLENCKRFPELEAALSAVDLKLAKFYQI